MGTFTRRDFLHDSAALAAAVASSGILQPVATAGEPATETAKKRGANDTLRAAVIGVRGQGMGHIKALAAKRGCMVATVCDADEAVIGEAMRHVEQTQGKAPKYEKDLRKVMEDKSIDIISTATPNHWHALIAIWAMQNGKDIYVEKPACHNISEGRRMVETARKYNRICQVGTQSRSSVGMRQTMEFLHSGKLGKVQIARGLCYKKRDSIGKVNGDQQVPGTVDHDLWCGPAPKNPLRRKSLHYDWHWTWDYGNGDLGNQGIHEMDKARWGLGKNELARSVISLGGRFGYVDDGETANTQICVFDYGDSQLIFEVRGLKTDPLRDVKVGNIFHCENGTLVCPSYTAGIAFDADGKEIARFKGNGDHFVNFITAVRERKSQLLHADILEGHLSSALCHLGNISYRLGRPASAAEAKQSLGDNQAAADTFADMVTHLGQNRVSLEETQCRVGSKLTIDSKSERFVSDPAADVMLTREYRKGFEVPEKV